MFLQIIIINTTHFNSSRCCEEDSEERDPITYNLQLCSLVGGMRRSYHLGRPDMMFSRTSAGLCTAWSEGINDSRPATNAPMDDSTAKGDIRAWRDEK